MDCGGIEKSGRGRAVSHSGELRPHTRGAGRHRFLRVLRGLDRIADRAERLFAPSLPPRATSPNREQARFSPLQWGATAKSKKMNLKNGSLPVEL